MQLKCARMLYERFFVPVLLYGSATMMWREKERSRVKYVQMNNLRGLLGVSRINRVLNARIKS